MSIYLLLAIALLSVFCCFGVILFFWPLEGGSLAGFLVASACYGLVTLFIWIIGQRWATLTARLPKLKQDCYPLQDQSLELRLEKQVQERTLYLQRALDFEAMLKRISDHVRDSLDEKQILQNAVAELVRVLGISYCNTATYHDNYPVAKVAWEYSESDLSFRTLVLPIEDFPDIYHQLLQGECFQFCTPIPQSQERAALLMCPIFDDQGILGDLLLYKPEFLAYDDLEIRLVQQVANQCAIAMRQARLYLVSQTQVTELEKLNRLKDEFLSTVSHELRTPMANMRMAIHMLKQVVDPQRQTRYLEILQAECNREIELINDLLDLQRLEAASYKLSITSLNLQDCLSNLIASFQERVYDRQQNLQLQLSPHVPTLLTDRGSLERILAELLNNACKYTPPGGQIILKAQAECSESTPTQPPVVVATFTIANQAEIPASELPRIFDKFYRIPNADPWKQGGTGLGLALVQKLVEQLQGDLWVESHQGWTEFKIQLAIPYETAIVAPV